MRKNVKPFPASLVKVGDTIEEPGSQTGALMEVKLSHQTRDGWHLSGHATDDETALRFYLLSPDAPVTVVFDLAHAKPADNDAFRGL